MNSEIKELYFDEPMLKMGFWGRFTTRLIIYSFYGIGAAFTLVLVLADIVWLRDAGWLLILFFADRLIHIGGAEKNFRHAPKGGVNIADYMTPAAKNILLEAEKNRQVLAGSFYLHILRRLLERKDIAEIFTRLNISIGEFILKTEEALEKSQPTGAGAEDLMKRAFEVAARLEGLYLEPRDILAALGLSGDAEIAKLFNLFGVSIEDLENAVIFSIVSGKLRSLKRMPATLTGLAYTAYRGRHRVMNRAWTARPTPTLDKYSRDLTDLARLEKVGFLTGHKEEYEKLADVLSRADRPNAILVGEEGIGKGTIIAHLAFRIVRDRVPEPLFDKRLVQLNIGELAAGAPPEELRARAQKIIDEIIAAGNIILFIPDIHQLAKTGGGLSLADIFLPAIKEGAFSVIGTTYQEDFKDVIVKRGDFTGAFEIINVSEISPSDAIKVLSYQSIILEKQYRVIASFGAIKKAVEIARRYFGDKPLPGSAELLLKEAFADARENKKAALAPEDVIRIAERKTNIPLRGVDGGEAKALLNLEEEIHKRLIDQEEAVTEVSRALREYRSGLSRRGGPIASFLFVGPTGVGKTELAKILAGIQFGSADAMLRFDMSEFQNKNSLPRLLGSAEAGVAGALVDAVAEKPFSLILLDEFEKAHPDILNVFLQVFDDGRLTSAAGRAASFEDAIIIATSNAHSDFIKAELEAGRGISEITEELKKKLSSYFRPELLNRFSAIIIFKTLVPAHILKIAELRLREVAEVVRESHGIELTFSAAAISEVSRLGYDPVFGARPLRGVISDKIKSGVAEKILKGELKRGENWQVDFVNGEFIFNKL